MTQKKLYSETQPSTILLVGGGTGGHICPLYNLAKELLQQGHPVHFIVNDAPLDKKVIDDMFSGLKGLNVHYLKTHKIHYHLSWSNLVAPFKILASFFRTKKLIKKIDPDVVFFKGGFVGFPVLIALKYLMRFKGKVYLHDTDISAGKLTQLIGKNADQVFSNFGENSTPLFYWPSSRISPLKGETKRGTSDKPHILIFGGSQGAQFLNTLIIQNAESLTQKYDITLVAGPQNQVHNKAQNLRVIDFMPQDELIQAMIKSDLVICRSGGSMFQVLAAKTPCIAIPLPTSARNHQLHNAQYFADKGLCYLLEQNDQTNQQLLPMVEQILADEFLQSRLDEYEGLPKAKVIAQAIT